MKRVFMTIFLGMLVGCTPPPDVPDPVEILSIDLSPLSGATTVCTADIYAKGAGRVEVKWFNRCDTTGEHRITSKYLLIDGEGNYETALDLTPTPLEYYYQAIIYDSAGTELKKSAEVFYGNGPTGPPVIKSLTATPSSGEAPLYVRFELLLQQACFTQYWVDMGDGYGLRGPFPSEGPSTTDRYTCGRPYDNPGTYTIIGISGNHWGADTIIKPDWIRVWE